MTDVDLIRTEADYETALTRIDELMDAEPATRKAVNSMYWSTSSICTSAGTSRWATRVR